MAEVKIKTMKPAFEHSSSVSRRKLLLAGSASLALPVLARAADDAAAKIVSPPEGKGILLSVKLGMIANKSSNGKPLTLAQRLSLAGEAGLDGVILTRPGDTLRKRQGRPCRSPGSLCTMRSTIHTGASV